MSETALNTIAEEQEPTKEIRTDEPPFGHIPDHTELPYEDGTFVKNFQEHPQSVLLTESLWPILQALHPDGHFAIGQDSGIYWRLTEPRENGATAPDWFYVPNVPPTLNGEIRRSYVLWQEYVAPLIVIEFISATDGGERDRTPNKGKFWIYEKAIRPGFYAIYDAGKGLVDVYHFVEDRFQPVAPNQRKHFEIPQLGIELGIWRGEYKNVQLPWLRAWDLDGNLLPTPEERAEQEAQRAEQEAQRAEQEAQRAEQEAQRAEQEAQRADREARRANLMAEKLRELGIDPDEV
jgi:Uma2 family endonuclease